MRSNKQALHDPSVDAHMALRAQCLELNRKMTMRRPADTLPTKNKYIGTDISNFISASINFARHKFMTAPNHGLNPRRIACEKSSGACPLSLLVHLQLYWSYTQVSRNAMTFNASSVPINSTSSLLSGSARWISLF